jgi:uncharacterized membrane protein YoaK (UPF0700 family)
VSEQFSREKPAGIRTEASALALAGGMVFLAGATDVYGLSKLRDLFVSFMSGNTTSLGVAIGSGDGGRAATAAVLIALFVAGAAAGTVLAEWSGRWHSVVVMVAVTVQLTIAAAVPSLSIHSVVLAMGALNAAFSRIGVTSVSLTYVTGALVKFGQGIGRLVIGRGGADWSWTVQGVMWVCLLAGAVVERCVQARLAGVEEVWVLAGLAAVLTIGCAAHTPSPSISVSGGDS